MACEPKASKPPCFFLLGKPARIILALIIAIAAIAWDGAQRRPTLPAEGITLRGITSAPSPRPLRVGIFNIAGGVGADGKRDLARTAATLKGCDIIGLNEVHAGFPWQHSNQADTLGEQLAMASLFAPTERRWWHDDFGNGILSHLASIHWQQFPLSSAKAHSNRNVLLVRLPYQGRVINVIITHLDRHEDHDLELRAVAELFLSLEPPSILLGDLNASSREHQIIRLKQTPGVLDVTGEAPVEHRDSDWIFSRGFRCRKAQLTDQGASDHPFYWADLELE
jgi:endonuclease/exonuclease/phosphatase family metal-dependent hydrolase